MIASSKKWSLTTKFNCLRAFCQIYVFWEKVPQKVFKASFCITRDDMEFIHCRWKSILSASFLQMPCHTGRWQANWQGRQGAAPSVRDPHPNVILSSLHPNVILSSAHPNVILVSCSTQLFTWHCRHHNKQNTVVFLISSNSISNLCLNPDLAF